MKVQAGERVARAILEGMGVDAAATMPILSASLDMRPDALAVLTVSVPFDAGALDALVAACKEAGLVVNVCEARP